MRISRLEKMRRTATNLDRTEKRDIVDMVNSDLRKRLSYRDTSIGIKEEDTAKSGATYLLCWCRDENTGKTYYVIMSRYYGLEFETESAYENWNDAKSDFDGLIR